MKKVIVKLPEDRKKAEEIRALLSQYGVDSFISSLGELGVERVTVKSQKDVEGLKGVASRAKGILVETESWRIIPLENIIAELSGQSEIYVEALNPSDAVALRGVLEKGVDYVIISPKSVDEAASYADALGLGHRRVELMPVKVKEVRLVGEGSRVCVDTIEMLGAGEGMLVGSFSNFLFLVHAEVFGSPFTSPRPFRVNAGAVHSYILVDGDRTKYLSEIRSGDRVLVSDYRGSARVTFVGRNKLERRPMVLIVAEHEGLIGTVVLQYAETVALVTPEGKPLAVTEIKGGDNVLAMVTRPSGRHFGLRVEEEIRES
ncbi:MAG: 3-dehydroquinate synthase II [Nitrososphaeria archaeon]